MAKNMADFVDPLLMNIVKSNYSIIEDIHGITAGGENTGIRVTVVFNDEYKKYGFEEMNSLEKTIKKDIKSALMFLNPGYVSVEFYVEG